VTRISDEGTREAGKNGWGETTCATAELHVEKKNAEKNNCSGDVELLANRQ